jgi:hypothetical protein
MVPNIIIFGGEPLDQDPEEFIMFLGDMKKLGLPVWVFTRYELEDVPMRVKILVDYIKTGWYDEKKTCNDNKQYGILLSTSNQKIYRKGKDY